MSWLRKDVYQSLHPHQKCVCVPYSPAIPFLGGYLEVIRQVNKEYLQRSLAELFKVKITRNNLHVLPQGTDMKKRNYVLTVEYYVTIKYYWRTILRYLIKWKIKLLTNKRVQYNLVLLHTHYVFTYIILYSLRIIYYIIYIIYSMCLHIVTPQYLWGISPKPTYIAIFVAARVSYIK